MLLQQTVNLVLSNFPFFKLKNHRREKIANEQNIENHCSFAWE